MVMYRYPLQGTNPEGYGIMKKRLMYLLFSLGLLVVMGVGLGVWKTGQASNLNAAQATTQAERTFQTATVRNGNISVSVSGTGSVVSLKSADLAFATSGRLSTNAVQLGDTVKKGQVLAMLANTDALSLMVKQQELAVQTAQQILTGLQNDGMAALAQAQMDLDSAQTAYATALANQHQKGDGRCTTSVTQNYYVQYLNAQGRVDEWEGYLSDPKTGYGHDYILQRLAPMRKERDINYANWQYCQGFSASEIQGEQAAVQVAKAQQDQAAARLRDLKSSAGVDASAVVIAQAALQNAQLQLRTAQANLAGATLIAPMDGTVTAVNAQVGDAVGTNPVITLTDLSNPQVQVNIDETDLSNFAAGCPAQVTFSALSHMTFAGKVMQVSPTLVTVQGASMAQGLVELEKKQTATGKALPLGLSAAVEVTCQQAQNTLVVSTQGLYENPGQPSYVYVLNTDGKPEKRAVQTGIQTVALVQITSGLKAGERVIISPITGQP